MGKDYPFNSRGLSFQLKRTTLSESLLQVLVEEVYALAEEVVAGVASTDDVVAVCVDQLAEVFVGLHECLDIFGGVLVVHVVIGQAVTEQQCAM